MQNFTVTLGWTVACLSAVSVTPQLRRLLKTRSTEGLSLTTATIATTTMWAWCCYTLRAADYPALASSLMPLLVWSLVLLFITSHRSSKKPLLLLMLLLALPLHPALSTPVAVTGSMVWIIPQAIRALRAPSLHAVSLHAYLLILVENVLWVLYGVLTGHLAYAAAPLVQIPLSALIARRVHSSRLKTPGASSGVPLATAP